MIAVGLQVRKHQPSRIPLRTASPIDRPRRSGSGTPGKDKNGLLDSATVLSLRSELKQALARSNQAWARVKSMSEEADGARAEEILRIAIVAHELRNPLAPMRTAAAILRCGRPEDTPRVHEIIDRQIAQMSRLIEDLIDGSRNRSGRLSIAMERVSLPEIVKQAVDASAPMLERRGQRLFVVGNSPGFDVVADAGRLLQILANLLGNASKYSPDGKEIRLGVSALDSLVALTVSDDGIGIAAEALADVFKPYMQESRAKTFDHFGLGVGLGVVRELVESHGGTVAVSSAGIGLGTCVVVTLPRRC